MARKRSGYYSGYWPSYESTRPLEADGIKAKSQRGKFTETWWGDRWIAALQPLMDSRRLSRGRSYARRGQVLEIDIQPGKIAARVQGSRRSPYKVTIELKPLNTQQWDVVLNALADQAIYAAQLLNGEMPDDIERIFDAVRVPLFPAAGGDLSSECSCPDWANPCKHIAAVYYLLGERFDGDPFLLFELRGRTQEQIAAELRKRRSGLGASAELAPSPYAPGSITAVTVAPLEERLESYWGSARVLDNLTVQIAAPPVALALLKRVGLPDFVDPTNFRAQLERAYAGVTDRALEVAFAEQEEVLL
jgi:uncharacterized Zn finger protein